MGALAVVGGGWWVVQMLMQRDADDDDDADADADAPRYRLRGRVQLPPPPRRSLCGEDTSTQHAARPPPDDLTSRTPYRHSPVPSSDPGIRNPRASATSYGGEVREVQYCTVLCCSYCGFSLCVPYGLYCTVLDAAAGSCCQMQEGVGRRVDD
jgi:hypothetical protein